MNLGIGIPTLVSIIPEDKCYTSIREWDACMGPFIEGEEEH